MLGLAMTNSIGFSATTAMALWITRFDTLYPDVPTWLGSALGSAQILAAVLANLAAPRLFKGRSCEQLCRLSSIMASGLALLMAFAPNASLFGAAAIGLGLALGLLLSGTNALLARAEHVQGSYASAQICEVAYAIGFFALAGIVIEAFGTAALFVMQAVLCVVAALIMAWFISFQNSPRVALDRGGVPPLNRHIVVASLAFVLFFVSQSSFFQHQLAIGARVGLSGLEVSRVLAIAMLGGLAGAVLGKVIGVRFGIRAPVMFTTLMLAIGLVVVMQTQSKLIYTASAVIIQGLTMALVPYGFAIFAGLDPTGRLPSQGPAMLLLGVAGGAVFAEALRNLGGYDLVGVVGGLVAALSCALYVFGIAGIKARPALM